MRLWRKEIIKILTSSATGGLCIRGFRRQCEEECRAYLALRFDPDSPAMRLHDFLANGQPEAGTGRKIADVKTLKRLEDLIPIPRVNADTVVAHSKTPMISLALGRYVNV